MSTPFVRQGVAAVISVGAALATILVSMLGSNATAAGAAAGAVAGGAVGEAAAGADTGATTGEAATGTNANIAAGAATATGGAPAGTVTGAATGQTASPEQGNPTSGTMRQAEYRQLQAHLEDLKTLAHTLARDELEWRTEWRRLFDLHQKGITNYQSNAAKVIFSFGKNVLDWTPISPTGPGKIVNTAVEKISSTVTDIITTPPSKGATDAQILEHMRKINKALEEKMEEAKKKTYEIHNELETVQNEIGEVNKRIQANPILLP